MNAGQLTFRDTVTEHDITNVREIVSSTRFFNESEVEVAVELVTERLAKGLDSGYYFIFAEQSGSTIGYSCYGPIPGTLLSYDLYWIAVHDKFRGQGIGKQLLERSETAIKQLGGSRIYIETSSREQYVPTRAFYQNNCYHEIAVFQDFYAPGDSKCVFLRVV